MRRTLPGCETCQGNSGPRTRQHAGSRRRLRRRLRRGVGDGGLPVSRVELAELRVLERERAVVVESRRPTAFRRGASCSCRRSAFLRRGTRRTSPRRRGGRPGFTNLMNSALSASVSYQTLTGLAAVRQMSSRGCTCACRLISSKGGRPLRDALVTHGAGVAAVAIRATGAHRLGVHRRRVRGVTGQTPGALLVDVGLRLRTQLRLAAGLLLDQARHRRRGANCGRRDDGPSQCHRETDTRTCQQFRRRD